MTRRIQYLFAIALALTVSGCSYHCNFEARGVIRDTEGRPIKNATVELFKADGTPHMLSSGRPATATTDLQGQFQVEFWTMPSGHEELAGWTAKLSAEGYESETIALAPVREPKGGNSTGYLYFHVSLRKANKV